LNGATTQKREFKKIPPRRSQHNPPYRVLYFEVSRGLIAPLKEYYMGSASISVDEFQALEQKVLQTVELIKREREARTLAEAGRAAAEAEVATAHAELVVAKAESEAVRNELAALKQELSASGNAQAEVESLHREREAVRLRVEKMLASIEEVV
jgi:hypothetical protein